MAPALPASPIVIAGVVCNILSVVGVVICNKYIIEVDNFNFSVFLSFLHFVFTTIGMRALLWADMFTYTPAPLSGVLPLALGSLLSVAFMNLNLAYNSVGFYQLSKLACIPFTLAIQYTFYQQGVSRAVQLTLVPITFGVGYATVYDLSLNTLGLLFALCGVIATAMAQILTNTHQRTLSCDALQLLYHTSPWIALGMLLMCPLFDSLPALHAYTFTGPCVARIALSCVFALGVNISNYLVLGKTSPLTYQVLGHMKTILILILGIVMFKKPLDMRNILGVTIAMIGVVAYTEVRRQQASAHVLPTTVSTSSSSSEK